MPIRVFMVDGTRVRHQKSDSKGRSKKVESRWAYASRGEKQPSGLVGMWRDQSWQKNRHDLERRLNYPGLEVLFSDGGPGIEANLLARWMRPQRCVLYGKRDFPYVLYADKLKKPQQQPFLDLFLNILVFHLKQADLESLKVEGWTKIKELAEQTEQGFRELLEALREEKYPKARIILRISLKALPPFWVFGC